MRMSFLSIPRGMDQQVPTALKRLRDRLHMTQAQLAQTVGVTRDQIANYAMGRTEVPSRVMDRLQSLGMTVVEDRAPYDEPPLHVRASRVQLRILINVLADESTKPETRELAKQELERALGLVGF